MYDAEITFLVIFVLLNVNYFRQNCMESIYVKCVLHVFALHFVHVQCICQQDCKVLLIYQHRVQERKKKDYIVF